MKVEELRKKSKSELEKIISDSGERLRVLRFDSALGKLKNVREIRKIKKDVARILTLLNKQRTISKEQLAKNNK